MVILMKVKPILKTLWISFLSTFTLVLSQTLTASGFENINTIKLPFLEVPIEYLIINFFVFVMLTILFILLNDLMPVHKLSKGVLYSFMVSLVWIALKFQPSAFENISKYIFDSIVFMIPILIYGVFLGYLATEKTKTFEFKKRQLGFSSISAVWILFHLIYMAISGSAKGQVFNYISWLIVASLILGLVFGLIYEFSLAGKKNSLFVTSISIVLIFVSFYAYQFAVQGEFDVKLLIRISLDITSIILAIQFFEIYLHRLQKPEK